VNAGDDDRIVARIEAAADSMPHAPVRWERVASLARRKALISAAVALALGLAAAALLTLGGSVSSYGIHGAAPIPIPFAGVSVPDVRGMSEAAALSRLKRAGLDGAADVRCGARSCVVRASDPGAGANVLNGSKVTLALAARVAAKPQPQEGRHGPRPGQGLGGKHAASKTTTPGHSTEKPGKPSRIVLSISRSTIEADGKSATMVEAIVLDTHGKRLKGRRVTFSSSDPGERIDVRLVSSTVSVATVTSSKRPQPVTIQARDGALVTSIGFEQTPVKEQANSGCSDSGGPGQESETTQTHTSTDCATGTQTTGPTTTPTPTDTGSTTSTTNSATDKSPSLE
jgi:hypothetical protein